MLKVPLYKAVSEKLFELFFVDDHKYGRQLESGLYKLIREKVSVVTIDDMLLNSKSLLTYQETHTLNQASLKWICIDLDIAKKEIDQNQVNPENLKKVRDAAEKICSFLTENQIDHLLEFSGRRGFHIWVIFEKLQSKEFGYELINYITSQVSLPSIIGLDKYPKTRDVSRNTKMVGFGVKLPLSQNKLSKDLSFFLRNAKDFEVYDKERLKKVNDKFLSEQLNILSSFTPLKEEKIEKLQSVFPVRTNDKSISDRGYLIKTRSILQDSEGENLEDILTSLSKCDHLREKLKDYQMGMGNKDRNLFVGLLGNLSSENNPNLGIKLLRQFFETMKGYRKDLTDEKLRFAKSFFPITCPELGRCDHCECKQISSPIEILNVKLEQIPSVSINNLTERIFENLKSSLRKYSLINDEIPLYHLLTKIENASFLEISKEIDKTYSGIIKPNPESYKFLRNEEDKVRELYSLNHVNNLVSTYFLYILHSLFYAELSDCSYGYRISPGLYGANIFGNWFVNWAKFSKKVSHVLQGEEFSEYFLVKVDIKSFYDRIDLQRLKIKMYEEAPFGVQQKLFKLTEEERHRYKYIIDYLLALSQNTTGHTKEGLPQGPAYARFLAEIYLTGLDHTIESVILTDRKREFYYRFVDDIFIFVEDEEKAMNVFKAIDKWARVNNLELNPLKSEVVNVKEYLDSGKYKRFQDDTKYLINKANKNKAILSDNDVREALSKLTKLTNDVKFGLKDNLRFFYYQFSGDPRLSGIKNKLLQFIPYSDSGRGTLYMMFYNDLIQYQPEKFLQIALQHNRLYGLSLGHYLNTMLFNQEFISSNTGFLESLLGNLATRDDLTSVDKVQIITLSKLYRIPLSDDFMKSCTKALIYSAMETPQIAYTSADFSDLEAILEEKKEKKELVKELYRIIIQNPLDGELAEMLSLYTITRFSQWADSTGVVDILDDETSILEYYHSLCFFSLFYKATSNSPLLKCWETLMEKSSLITLSKPITFEWLTRAVEFPREEFSEKSHYTMLLTTKEGSALKKHKCEHGFITQFQNILLVLLFSKEINPQEFEGEKKDKLDESSLFGEWLYDDNVRLYPKDDRDICVKNLALNGLIILERDKEIFAKRVNDEGELKLLDYLEISKTVENEVQIVKKETISIYDSAKDFKTLLKVLANFIETSAKFMTDHQLQYPVYYKKPLSSGDLPLIPFYSQFSHKISNFGSSQLNDINAFWENIMYIVMIKNAELDIVKGMHNKFNYKVSEIEDRFFPKSKLVMESTQDKFDFICEFILAINESNIESAQQFQYFWSKAMWNLLKRKRSKSNITEFLGAHLSNFHGKENMPNDVMFAVSDRSIISDENLESFHRTIQEALVDFQLQVETNDNFSISSIIDEEITILESFFQEKNGIGTKDFRKIELSFSDDINIDTGKVELNIQINGNSMEGKSILTFTRDPIGFNVTNIQTLSIEPKEKVFGHVGEKEVLLFIPDSELIRSFERIADRSEFIQKSQGHAQYSGLFPEDENYLTAQQSYEDCNFVTLERKLGLHYSSTKNIRERVVRWLSLFNEKSILGSNFETFLKKNRISLPKVYRAILDLIVAHHEISCEASEKFCGNTKKYFGDADMIVFPLKNPDSDKNGLYRLFTKYGFGERELHFEGMARKMFTEDCSGKTLIIIIDVAISGGQATSSLLHYLEEYKTQEAFDAGMKKINTTKKFFLPRTFEESRMFLKNWKNLKNIVFMTPLITDAFKTKILGLPFIDKKIVSFEYTNELKEHSYNFKKSGLDNDQEEIINELITDKELLENIFYIPRPDECLPILSKIPDLNIILRVGSLPRKHIRLFSQKPKKGNRSLFDYIDNWDENDDRN